MWLNVFFMLRNIVVVCLCLLCVVVRLCSIFVICWVVECLVLKLNCLLCGWRCGCRCNSSSFLKSFEMVLRSVMG